MTADQLLAVVRAEAPPHAKCEWVWGDRVGVVADRVRVTIGRYVCDWTPPPPQFLADMRDTEHEARQWVRGVVYAAHKNRELYRGLALVGDDYMLQPRDGR